ncbi:hypothetical protein EYC84_006200 [Monilinia fructicola]|uniref:Uncharacterized protein n=1 Tax=Monilinia fructicola TaxID=38448 RepID=A0A5M9K5E2_MONFR|nr:hypothetical protein EYC84_006200 [Monilinia fructicola]
MTRMLPFITIEASVKIATRPITKAPSPGSFFEIAEIDTDHPARLFGIIHIGSYKIVNEYAKPLYDNGPLGVYVQT